MAARIGPLVEYGELRNTRHYATCGLLKLKGRDDPVRFDLTGNPGPDLCGRAIRFEPRPPEEVAWWEPEADLDLAEVLQPHQIGATGTMTAAEKVKVTRCPPHELYLRSKAGEPPPFEWKPRLYLEWYSQNGRVVIDMVDPLVEWDDQGEPPAEQPEATEADEEDSDLSAGPDVGIVRRTGDGDFEEWHGSAAEYLAEREDEDPYGLFSEELQRSLDSQSRQADEAAMSDEDRELIRELELMDDLIEHSDGEPLVTSLQTPKAYPHPDRLNDEEVEGALKAMLTELALWGIALDVCEHYTPRDAYRLLVEELLPNHRAHPELRGTGWVTHYSTWEFCPECEAQAEREYEEYQREHPEPDDEPTDEDRAQG
ncbi:MAG: hypothetical protein ACODAJ_12750 [Planctomycetota bacterium]